MDKLTNGVQIGSEDHHVTINRFGELRYSGKATTWEDIQTSVIGVQLDVAAGKADRNFDNNSITLQPGGAIATDGDCLTWSIQYPHKARTNGYLHVHMHWEQVKTFAGEMTLHWRIQHNGQAKETDWTPVTVPFGDEGQDVYEYESGTLMQITELAVIGPVTGLSDILQFRLARTDEVTGDIEVIFLDAHYEIDSTGSAQEYVK
jgi:hypothetical protein